MDVLLKNRYQMLNSLGKNPFKTMPADSGHLGDFLCLIIYIFQIKNALSDGVLFAPEQHSSMRLHNYTWNLEWFMMILKTETHTHISKINGTFDNYYVFCYDFEKMAPFRNDFSDKKLRKLYETAGITKTKQVFRWKKDGGIFYILAKRVTIFLETPVWKSKRYNPYSGFLEDDVRRWKPLRN